LEIKNVFAVEDWFEVLQTGERVQTALMTLQPGKCSGEEPEAHRDSDQVLLVLDGEVEGEIESSSTTLKKGDVIVIPAGTRHKFINRSSRPVVTFNTYSPPEY
jgi:mannose-6-phosphate isomerase-like protein (cupin superfamily)